MWEFSCDLKSCDTFNVMLACSFLTDLPQRIIEIPRSERPRSASVQINPIQLQFTKKKPLRNFTRARPSSGRFGRIRLDSSSQISAETCKVDDAFANIRSQLVMYIIIIAK